jgi:hypothetical protein
LRLLRRLGLNDLHLSLLHQVVDLARDGHHSGKHLGQHSRRGDDLQNQIDDNRLAYDQKKKDYQRTYEAGLALAEKIKAAKASARSRAAARAERLDIARVKIDRLLRIGKQLTEADMRAIFDAALNEPAKKTG